MTTSRDAAAEIVGGRRPLIQWDWPGVVAGTLMLALTFAIWAVIPSSLVHFTRISSDGFYNQEFLRLDTILAGMYLSAYLLTPALAAGAAWLRPRWRDAYTYGTLAAVCAFMWFFVLHFGRWQFGAYDYNIMIDVGWRQILGQRPYVDFPATTPPGFHLGIKYAFEVFGVTWDANLYLTAIFACATFLWMFWLMTLLSMGRLAALGVALAIECAGVLTLCFWWYNDSAMIASAVFFLSCLAYARNPQRTAVQVSYLASLTLFSLMKPNIAGPTIACGVALLFFATDRKLRLAMLTLGGAVAALAVLALNHVPVAMMLRSYLSVATERGSIGARPAYRLMSGFEQHSALFWISVLSLPLLGAAPKAAKQVWQRDWQGLSLTLFLPLSLLIALYGLATNAEFRDTECTALLAAGGVISFGLRWNGRFLRRATIAILCATMAGDLYYGAERTRVYGIGPHLFFEWQDNQHRIDSGFLKNMRVAAPMIETEREVRQALDANPGPYFLGPRVDLYAVFGLRSPEGLPVYWQPGTSFSQAAAPQVLQDWRSHRFQTLIFIKDWPVRPDRANGRAFTFYPPQFLDIIDHEYVRDDDGYPDIMVYRLRGRN